MGKANWGLSTGKDVNEMRTEQSTSNPPEPTLDIFSSLFESDIDLMLLEEFWCNSDFPKWILNQICTSTSKPLPEAVYTLNAKHSVGGMGAGAGETDLWVKLRAEFTDRSEDTLLLIENKISAPFTKDQAARYRMRLRSEVEQAGCQVGFTVLLAPEGYLKTCDPLMFDSLVAYERIEQFFKDQARTHSSPSDQRRSKYRSQAIRHAVEQLRRSGGKGLIFSAANTGFFGKCHELIHSKYPELNVRPDKARGPSSSYIKFNFAGNTRLRDVCGPGNAVYIPTVILWFSGKVTVRLEGFTKHASRLGDRLPSILPAWMVLYRVSNVSVEAQILDLPVIDSASSFESQVDSLQAGLEGVRRAKGWIESHVEQIAAWITEMNGNNVLPKT